MLMDSHLGAPSPTTPAPPRHPSFTPSPGRDDCWTEDSTFALIDSWGDHYLHLNRGNLRQKHWQEVADAVNHRRAITAGNGNIKKNARRTHVQCKNRIDTLKKKYKIEKGRVSDFAGGYKSPWPFFSRLDALIGDTYPIKNFSPPVTTRSNPSTVTKFPPPAWITSVPVGPRSGTKKRPAIRDEFIFRRNSAFAAAAAATAEVKSDDSGSIKRSTGTRGRQIREESEKEGEYGCKDIAIAIVRFGEIYERVESAKLRQMVELEKQRMQFAKDLESQRIQLFMETQLQLHKVKRTKHSSGEAILQMLNLCNMLFNHSHV